MRDTFDELFLKHGGNKVVSSFVVAAQNTDEDR